MPDIPEEIYSKYGLKSKEEYRHGIGEWYRVLFDFICKDVEINQDDLTLTTYKNIIADYLRKE